MKPCLVSVHWSSPCQPFLKSYLIRNVRHKLEHKGFKMMNVQLFLQTQGLQSLGIAENAQDILLRSTDSIIVQEVHYYFNIIFIIIIVIIIIIIIIVSITKFSIMTGSPLAYLSHNRCAIMWVFNYRCPIWTFCNWIPVIGYPRDFHVNYARFNGFLLQFSKLLGYALRTFTLKRSS